MRLVIPNKEVRCIFVNKIRSWFEDKLDSAADALDEMYRAMMCGDAQTVERIVSSQLRYTISYHDRKEDFYHGFLVGLLSPNQNWYLASNREAGLGRSDIMLRHYDNRLGIVIEIKRAAKASEMEDKCGEALRQIAEKSILEK